MKIELNIRQARRILNVARSLDESPLPEAFTMKCFVRGSVNEPDKDKVLRNGWCGTPACAIGHYAARHDLQKVLTIKKTPYGSLYIEFRAGKQKNEINYGIDYGNADLHEYFGLDEDGMHKLFGSNGCNNARKPATASKYIKNYVKKHTTEAVQRQLGIMDILY